MNNSAVPYELKFAALLNFYKNLKTCLMHISKQLFAEAGAIREQQLEADAFRE